MTTTPTPTINKEQPSQYRHIVYNRRLFEYMTISRKSVIKGINFHNITYRSNEDGYDVLLQNCVINPENDDIYLEEHRIDGSGTSDKKHPSELFVFILPEQFFVKLQDKYQSENADIIDIIPLSEIHDIRFDSYEGSYGSTILDDVIMASRMDLKQIKEASRMDLKQIKEKK